MSIIAQEPLDKRRLITTEKRTIATKAPVISKARPAMVNMSLEALFPFVGGSLWEPDTTVGVGDDEIVVVDLDVLVAVTTGVGVAVIGVGLGVAVSCIGVTVVGIVIAVAIGVGVAIAVGFGVGVGVGCWIQLQVAVAGNTPPPPNTWPEKRKEVFAQGILEIVTLKIKAICAR